MPELTIKAKACCPHQLLPLLHPGKGPDAQQGWHQSLSHIPTLPSGAWLVADGVPLFLVQGNVYLPGHTRPLPMLQALQNVEDREYRLEIQTRGYSLVVITLSDKGFAGEREDKSGPAIAELLGKHLELSMTRRILLPDDPGLLRALVLGMAYIQSFDLIVCTGGTGLGPRDQSPEALEPLLEKRLHGFEQAMINHSLTKTPHAIISRLLAGTIGQCLLLALPGSVKAATENLEVILPAIPHALAKLKGDPTDCGG